MDRDGMSFSAGAGDVSAGIATRCEGVRVVVGGNEGCRCAQPLATGFDGYAICEGGRVE